MVDCEQHHPTTHDRNTSVGDGRFPGGGWEVFQFPGGGGRSARAPDFTVTKIRILGPVSGALDFIVTKARGR